MLLYVEKRRVHCFKSLFLSHFLLFTFLHLAIKGAFLWDDQDQ